jgi:hypothetical protein
MGSRVWLWPNLLSLDAPLIALLWQVLFVRCFHSRLAPLSPVLLAISVWLIYAADHALDALLHARGAADRPRHEFYRRHWRLMLPVWTLALSLCAWLAWTYLPAAEFDRGAMLISGVAIYLCAVHAIPGALRRPGSKEAIVALLFGLGTTLAAWQSVSTSSDVLAIVLFAVLCWVNCTVIEDWEGGRPARKGASFASGAIALIAVLLLREHRPVLGCAETASAMGLMLVDRMRGRLSTDALRVLADAMLATPLLFLPVAGLRI